MVNRKRVNRFEFRADDKEAANLRRRISLSNKETFQAYAHQMLLNGKIETYDYSELQQLRIEVNRIGQNVNQLIRYVNTFGDLDKELLVALQAEIKKMTKLITKEFKTKGKATSKRSKRVSFKRNFVEIIKVKSLKPTTKVDVTPKKKRKVQTNKCGCVIY